jgi:hypothetical protein
MSRDTWILIASYYSVVALLSGTIADSDDLARVFRFDLAQDSEMISPTIPI